jgi:hypothetical protein
MKAYHCVCGQLIFFENTSCVVCGRELGFLQDELTLRSLEPAGKDEFSANGARRSGALYKKCQNYEKNLACNWMIAKGTSSGEEVDPFCLSCRLNQTIPDLSCTENQRLWLRMETAKRRLVYSLLKFKLPVANKTDDPRHGLGFAFLEDQKNADGSIAKVMTGHSGGLITLNITEADDSIREKIRHDMGEPLRTLLGHFRHEIGHYYWDRLVKGTGHLKPFRKLFGDEQANYEEALKRHYQNPAPANWQDNYISAYATSHPWEDWAETWAHFMHIQDTLEAANDFGLVGKAIRLDPGNAERKPWLSSEQQSFEGIIGAWAELAIALNSINRAMGLSDTYPFVLSPAVIAKLEFVFEVISGRSAGKAAAAGKGRSSAIVSNE